MERDWNIKWSALDLSQQQAKKAIRSQTDTETKRQVLAHQLQMLGHALEMADSTKNIIDAFQDDDEEGLHGSILSLVVQLANHMHREIEMAEAMWADAGKDYEVKRALKRANKVWDSMNQFVYDNLPIETLATLCRSTDNPKKIKKTLERLQPERQEELKAALESGGATSEEDQ